MEDLASLEREIGAEVIVVNLADARAARAAAGQAGAIDLLVNNAGIAMVPLGSAELTCY